MGSMSLIHWIIVGAVLLLVFGGRNKISDVMGDVAKGIKSFKKGLSDDDEAKPAARAVEPMRSIDHYPAPPQQPYAQAQQPYAPAAVQPYAPGVAPAQPYAPQGQAYPPQGQPYQPQEQPYQPQAHPYHPQVQPAAADGEPVEPRKVG